MGTQSTNTIPTWDRETLVSALRDEYGAEALNGVWLVVSGWLDRGDGCAVYENHDFGSRELGHRQFTSYGSATAQLETAEPPVQMPDIGTAINWRYQLVAVCKD